MIKYGDFIIMKPYKGFTLAEVLIALFIIGVISAITISSLIQSTQKQEFVSSLQKTYSTLSQVTNQIIAEEGNPNCEIGGWACSDLNVYDMYKKYLINAKECGKEFCMPQNSYKFLDKSTNIGKWNGMSEYSLILNDGVVFGVNSSLGEKNCTQMYYNWRTGSNNVCAVLLVDLNGRRGPNIANRDLFQFVLKEDGLYPAGCDNPSMCDITKTNVSCACKVLSEGAMNY